jgi:hypothetical protein
MNGCLKRVNVMPVNFVTAQLMPGDSDWAWLDEADVEMRVAKTNYLACGNCRANSEREVTI